MQKLATGRGHTHNYSHEYRHQRLFTWPPYKLLVDVGVILSQSLSKGHTEPNRDEQKALEAGRGSYYHFADVSPEIQSTPEYWSLSKCF